jgi:benzoate membrane transport protein
MSAPDGLATPSVHSSPVRDLSFPAVVAGMVAVLVSFSGTAVLMVQAGKTAGLDAVHIGSWIGSICVALGVSGTFLSLRLRLPVVMAWSTPGAALLVTALAGVPFEQAVGAFMLASALTLLLGLLGWIDPIVRRLPHELAAAMLVGILLNFGLGVFRASAAVPALVLPMAAAYLVCRRYVPRYAVLGVLIVGLALALASGGIATAGIEWRFTTFVWTTPVFTWQAAVSIGVPLFIVAMASQNLPGLAILRAAGYRPPASKLMAYSGAAGLVAAPFGAHSITLAAIVAAICCGREAHPDPGRRYIAAATYGVLYILLGLAAGTVTLFFQSLPQALIAALAGLALLGAIMGGMATAMSTAERREPALITLLATASGASFLGIGSAFWGLAAGLLAYAAICWKRPAASTGN